MRRTEDKLPAVPAAGAAYGPDLDIWGGGWRAGPGTGLVRLPRPQHAPGKNNNTSSNVYSPGFSYVSYETSLHFPFFDLIASLSGLCIFIFSCFLSYC
jgi:hypothetical protein